MILVDTSLQVRIDLVSRIIASHCSEAFEKSEAYLRGGSSTHLTLEKRSTKNAQGPKNNAAPQRKASDTSDPKKNCRSVAQRP